MYQSTNFCLKASGAVVALALWAAACTSASDDAESDASAAATGPASGTVGTSGASGSGMVNGTVASGSPTGTTSGTTTAGEAASAVTGSGGAASVTGTTGTAGASSSATSQGPVTTTGAGGATTGAATTATATTGGMEEEPCLAPTALSVPLLVDFEGYDGATVALDWGFEFNDDGSGENILYGGFFDASDGSGMASLDMVGSDTSVWAVRGANIEASDWGGGIGIWLGCMNATSFTGLSLAVRGSTPNSNAVDVAISADGLAGSVRQTITVTDLLQTFELPFADFTNEYDETTNGANINGLSVNAIMVWVQDETTEEWNVTPGAYELVVDDITFY